jgi:Kyakuja-Dileera-Zisupton transposase
MDANFENKRCHCSGKSDQPLWEPHSFFVPEDVVSSMQKIVEMKRGSHAVQALEDDSDTVLPGLQLQNHVFDGCSNSFVAAKESNQKASSSIFADTGLMALTCRHDRVISMVNLRDAGEKQYNALALLQQLFEELPENWNVGMLYDIGCQLHKSITKVWYCKLLTARHQILMLILKV